MLDDVLAILNGADDGGISGRAADAALFQLLDERGFVVARRRLGEVLLVLELFEFEGLDAIEDGELVRALIVVVLLVFNNLIDLEEAVEAEDGAADAEIVGLAVFGGLGGDVGRGDVVDGGDHLRSDEALPDEAIELELLIGEIAGDGVGRARGIGGTNGFVRVLRGLFALVGVGRRGQIFCTEIFGDPVAGRGDCFRSDAGRIGTHVRDEADGAFCAYVDTFIKTLRHAHGAADVEAELAGCIALELAGDEGRQRAALLLSGLHGGECPLCIRESGERFVHGGFAGEGARDPLRFAVFVGSAGDAGGLAIDADEAGLEGFLGLLFRMQQCVESPVFNGLECADLAFAFDDEAHGDGLHAAGGETAANFIPEERGYLVADETVEDAAGLLRVD